MELFPDLREYSPSVYYAHSQVACGPQVAWQYALSYEIWNPGLREARITRICGRAREEGEVVLIQAYESGVTLAPFYARTVRLVPLQHVAWLVYPEMGDSYCNFLDFGFVQLPAHLQFKVCYYTQDKLSGEALIQQRRVQQSAMDTLAIAFKNHCEANSRLP